MMLLVELVEQERIAIVHATILLAQLKHGLHVAASVGSESLVGSKIES